MACQQPHLIVKIYSKVVLVDTLHDLGWKVKHLYKDMAQLRTDGIFDEFLEAVNYWYVRFGFCKIYEWLLAHIYIEQKAAQPFIL